MNTIPQDALVIINRCIEEDEGGWVFTDRADDAGGPTYGGMTWKTFDAWQQRATKEPLALISRKDFVRWAQHHPDAKKVLQNRILQCYYATFYLPGHVAEIPSFIRQAYFSELVNTGSFKETLKALQMAFNNGYLKYLNTEPVLQVDGHWGPKTAKACAVLSECTYPSTKDPIRLAFSDACIERRIRIVQRNSREWRDWGQSHADNHISYLKRPKTLQSENLMGWFNRAKRYRNM